MPVYLRKFYTRQLLDTKKKEKEQAEKAQNKSSSTSHPGIAPKFKPPKF